MLNNFITEIVAEKIENKPPKIVYTLHTFFSKGLEQMSATYDPFHNFK